MDGIRHQKSIEKVPKDATSSLQPLDADIIRVFKLKYCKLLSIYVISRLENNKRVSVIINGI